MRKKLLAIALLSAIATPAIAADTGKYVVGSVGLTSGISDTDSGMSFGGLAGYQINPVWSVEGGYTSLVSDAGITAAGVTGKVSLSGFEFAGVYTHPINDQVSALVRLGYASMTIKANVTAPVVVSTSDDVSGTLFGVAGQYQLNEQLAVRAGFNSYSLSTSSGASGESPNNFFAAAVYKF